MQIEKALERFLCQLKADGRSVHTRKQYARHIRLFSSWLQNTAHTASISAITHDTVARRFLSSPKAQNNAHGGIKTVPSMNRLRTSVKMFLKYLHRSGLVASDRGLLVRQAYCCSPPPKALSNGEYDKLHQVLSTASSPTAKRDFTLFTLIANTGIRLSSALGLDVVDVDL